MEILEKKSPDTLQLQHMTYTYNNTNPIWILLQVD